MTEVEKLIVKDLSPEQISGVLQKEKNLTISHERIYQYIWEDKREKGSLHLHLRRKGRKYRKRGRQKDSRGVLVGRVGIEHRPKEPETRSEFGHLEIDTIIGKNQKGPIITLNDRACGMLWMRKVKSRDTELVRVKTCEMLDEIRPYIKSITADNGKEFAEHQYITDEYCNYYFATPYNPWEPGSNENLNGLVRQYLPKRTDFKPNSCSNNATIGILPPLLIGIGVLPKESCIACLAALYPTKLVGVTYGVPP